MEKYELTDLEKIVLEYPYGNWNYIELSKNPCISWKFIKIYNKKGWDYYDISTRDDITWKIVKENPNFPWNYQGLSGNKNITWKIVQDNPELPWNYHELSRNGSITWEIIKDNPELPWDKSKFIDKNPNCTWKILKEYLAQDERNTWNITNINCILPGIIEEGDLENISFFDKLQESEIITWDFVKKHPELNWKYKILSRNPNITWDIVKDNPDKDWNYCVLSKNKNITLEIVEANSDKSWSFANLAANENFTWKIIQKYSYDFNYEDFGANPNLTFEIAKEIIDILEDNHACNNGDFDDNDYCDNCNSYHDDYSVCEELDLTEFFTLISSNKFEKTRKKIEKARRIIQNAIIKWIYQPIIKDGKLGINARLGLKLLYNLKETPIYLTDIKLD